MVKLLKIFAVACNSIIFKSMETDFLKMTTMASKEKITGFNVLFDQALQKLLP